MRKSRILEHPVSPGNVEVLENLVAMGPGDKGPSLENRSAEGEKSPRARDRSNEGDSRLRGMRGERIGSGKPECAKAEAKGARPTQEAAAAQDAKSPAPVEVAGELDPIFEKLRNDAAGPAGDWSGTSVVNPVRAEPQTGAGSSSQEEDPQQARDLDSGIGPDFAELGEALSSKKAELPTCRKLRIDTDGSAKQLSGTKSLEPEQPMPETGAMEPTQARLRNDEGKPASAERGADAEEPAWLELLRKGKEPRRVRPGTGGDGSGHPEPKASKKVAAREKHLNDRNGPGPEDQDADAAAPRRARDREDVDGPRQEEANKNRVDEKGCGNPEGPVDCRAVQFQKPMQRGQCARNYAREPEIQDLPSSPLARRTRARAEPDQRLTPFLQGATCSGQEGPAPGGSSAKSEAGLPVAQRTATAKLSRPKQGPGLARKSLSVWRLQWKELDPDRSREASYQHCAPHVDVVQAGMDEVSQEEARAEIRERRALPDHGELPSAAGMENTFSKRRLVREEEVQAEHKRDSERGGRNASGLEVAAADNEETDAAQVMPKAEAEGALPDQVKLLRDISNPKSALPMTDASGPALEKLLGSGIDADFEQSRTGNAVSVCAKKLAGTGMGTEAPERAEDWSDIDNSKWDSITSSTNTEPEHVAPMTGTEAGRAAPSYAKDRRKAGKSALLPPRSMKDPDAAEARWTRAKESERAELLGEIAVSVLEQAHMNELKPVQVHCICHEQKEDRARASDAGGKHQGFYASRGSWGTEKAQDSPYPEPAAENPRLRGGGGKSGLKVLKANTAGLCEDIWTSECEKAVAGAMTPGHEKLRVSRDKPRQVASATEGYGEPVEGLSQTSQVLKASFCYPEQLAKALAERSWTPERKSRAGKDAPTLEELRKEGPESKAVEPDPAICRSEGMESTCEEAGTNTTRIETSGRETEHGNARSPGYAKLRDESDDSECVIWGAAGDRLFDGKARPSPEPPDTSKLNPGRAKEKTEASKGSERNLQAKVDVIRDGHRLGVVQLDKAEDRQVGPRFTASSATSRNPGRAVEKTEDAGPSRAKLCNGGGGPVRSSVEKPSTDTTASTQEELRTDNGLSLPAVKDFVGEGGGLGGFLAEPALTALDRQWIAAARQVSQPVHPREQNFAEATGLLHVRVPMPTMLSPGGKDPGVAAATAGGEKQLPRRAMPSEDADELVQEELRKNMNATTNSKDTGPILARPVTDTIKPRIVGMRKNRVATRLLLAKRLCESDVLSKLKEPGAEAAGPGLAGDRGGKEEPGVLLLQTESAKTKPARLKPDKDDVDPQRKGDRIGRAARIKNKEREDELCPGQSHQRPWLGGRLQEPALTKLWADNANSPPMKSRADTITSGTVTTLIRQNGVPNMLSQLGQDFEGADKGKPQHVDFLADMIKGGKNSMCAKPGVSAVASAHAEDRDHEAVLGCPFYKGLELAIRSQIGQETVATARGIAKSSVDISIAGKAKQNPSHDEPRPAVSTIESDQLKDLAKNGSSKCAKLDAKSETPVREHLMTESAEPARAKLLKSIGRSGVANCITGTARFSHAEDLSGRDTSGPATPSAEAGNPAFAHDRGDGTGPCTPPTAELQWIPDARASTRGMSTWLNWCKGDVESTLAGSDAGDADSRHRQLLKGKKKPECKKSTTKRASPVLAKDCEGNADPDPAPDSTRTGAPSLARLCKNEKNPVPRFSETDRNGPSLETLTTERLLASREEPCDDKRTPSRPEPNAISTASKHEQLRRNAEISRQARFGTKGISPGQVLPDNGAELPARAEDLKGKGEPSFARFKTEATEPQQENV
ncbi:unnamed protein product [Symbiodinium sp. KB8]|nr:unnamed protein product [Symbiodinium sp. KB8]